MREIAEAAGVSKPLLYHYFPSKIDLFKAAVAESAAELRKRDRTGRPGGSPPSSSPADPRRLPGVGSKQNAVKRGPKLMESAATLPEAREMVEGFRAQTMEMVAGPTKAADASPVRRCALRSQAGWATRTRRSSIGRSIVICPVKSCATC